MANDLATIENADLARDLAAVYRVSPNDLIRTIKTQCFPNGAASDSQLVIFLTACRERRLNPFLKEVYAFIRDGKMQIGVEIDGWIRKAQEHPQYDGCEYIDVWTDDRKIFSVTCRIYRKDWKRPGEYTALFSEWNVPSNGVWISKPRHMLAIKAFNQCVRFTLGLTGISDSDDIEPQFHNVDHSTGEVMGATPPAELNGANAELHTIADAKVVPNEQAPEQTAPSSVVVQPETPPECSTSAPEPEPPKTQKKKATSGDRARLKELADRLPPNRIVILCGQMGCENIEEFNDEQVTAAIARLERRAS